MPRTRQFLASSSRDGKPKVSWNTWSFAEIINQEEVNPLVLPIWQPSHLGEVGL